MVQMMFLHSLLLHAFCKMYKTCLLFDRWIFQSVDTAVESFIGYVDKTVGAGHGHRVSIYACTVFFN
jgi:hypothetical protein